MMFNLEKIAPITLIVFSIAAYAEISYGSLILGLIFLSLSLITLILIISEFRQDVRFVQDGRSLLLMFSGIFIVLVDILYNYFYNSEIQTLDSMVIIFGLSLLIFNLNQELSKIGLFGIYFSILFLLMFVSLFTLPLKLGLNFVYVYGHYGLTVPVVELLKIVNLDIRIADFRIIEVVGVEHLFLRIDLECFGWNSSLLALSMIFAYNLTFKFKSWKYISKAAILLIFVAYFANMLRVLILILLAYYYGSEVMLGVHPHLGWIIFALIILPISYKILR